MDLNNTEKESITTRTEANLKLRDIIYNKSLIKSYKGHTKGLEEEFIPIKNDFPGLDSDDSSKINKSDETISLNSRTKDISDIKYKEIDDPQFNDFHKNIIPSLSAKNITFYQKLHLECVDLIDWLTPTPLEKHLRFKAFKRVEILTKMIWNNCTIKAFGSSLNGLSLPDGDLDISIIEVPGDVCMNLKLLGYLIIELGIAKGVELILTAKVPILKFIDRETNILTDISINQASSSTTSDYLSQKLEIFYHMKPLILLIKLYLKLRGLNETYSGGIGSYLLSLMVLNFLQLHPSSSDSQQYNFTLLSHLFVDFFFTYGYQRDLENFACSVRGLGHLFPRSLRSGFSSSFESVFSVENPLDIDVDIGKSAYNSYIVRESFRKTFTELCYLSQTAISPQRSILSHIYDYTHPYFVSRPSKDDVNEIAYPEKELIAKELSEELLKRISLLIDTKPNITTSSYSTPKSYYQDRSSDRY